MYDIQQAEVREWAAGYTGPRFHALLTDPPYELGFMGRDWDKSGIAFDPDTWAAFHNVLHPGAFGMAFASARGWHRLAVAIEDAGYVIHPSIFGWAYGSGFPKATDVPKTAAKYGAWAGPEWEGYKYGKQALKPALEPVIVFQRPYEGRPIDSIARTGAGALNVAGSAIPGEERPLIIPKNGKNPGDIYGDGLYGSKAGGTTNAPRHPANLVLGHSPECHRLPEGWACAAECRIHQMHGAGFFFQYQAHNLETAEALYYCSKAGRKERDAGLEGREARPAHGMAEQTVSTRSNRKCSHCGRMKFGQPYCQCPEPAWVELETSKALNPHPCVKPIELTTYLAGLLCPPEVYRPRLLVPFAGSGSEVIGGIRAGFWHVTGIERDAEFVDIARQRAYHWAAEHLGQAA